MDFFGGYYNHALQFYIDLLDQSIEGSTSAIMTKLPNNSRVDIEPFIEMGFMTGPGDGDYYILKPKIKPITLSSLSKSNGLEKIYGPRGIYNYISGVSESYGIINIENNRNVILDDITDLNRTGRNTTYFEDMKLDDKKCFTSALYHTHPNDPWYSPLRDKWAAPSPGDIIHYFNLILNIPNTSNIYNNFVITRLGIFRVQINKTLIMYMDDIGSIPERVDTSILTSLTSNYTKRIYKS